MPVMALPAAPADSSTIIVENQTAAETTQNIETGGNKGTDDVEMVPQDEEAEVPSMRENIDMQTKARYYKPAAMRISRWEAAEERTKRKGWGAASDKTFTP